MHVIHRTSQLPPARVTDRSKPPLWRRLLTAVMDAQQRKAERLMAEMIKRNGGRLTDEIERQIGLFQ